MSNSAVVQQKVIQREVDEGSLTSAQIHTIQMVVGKNKRRKKSTSSAKPTYGGCFFNAFPLTVKNAVFFDRPPSNSRTMPGTAMKNKKSTKGHGEGGSKGGIYHAEQKVKAGNVVKGNVWVNVLSFFDGAADKSLMQNPTTLEAKLEWLMALFSRAAPTIYGLIESDDLTLLPDTNLSDALRNKFSAIDAIGIEATLQPGLILNKVAIFD